MNCRAIRKLDISVGAKKEIQRIDDMWSQQMTQYPGQWLFGDWSIADAMYAPIVLRFETYGIALSEKATEYKEKVLNSPAVQLWLEQANAETDIVQEDEAGQPV